MLLQTVEQGLKASLNADARVKKGSVIVEGTTLKELVQSILGEEMEKLKKVRLTWNRDKAPIAPDRSLQVGELRKWLPYIGPLGKGRYYIQNTTVFHSNGVEADPAKISDKRWVETVRDKAGNITEYERPSDLELVTKGLTDYLAAALKTDPNLCRYCGLFTAPDRTAYMKHVYKQHRDEFNKEMGEEPESRIDPNLAAAGPIEPKRPYGGRKPKKLTNAQRRPVTPKVRRVTLPPQESTTTELPPESA